MAPPVQYPVKKLIAITPDIAKAIEDYRFSNRLKTEAEAIRRLIEAGLGKTSTAIPSGGGEPGESDKPAGSVAPAPKKRAGSDRKAKPAAVPRSKLEQIRALREQGTQ